MKIDTLSKAQTGKMTPYSIAWTGQLYFVSVTWGWKPWWFTPCSFSWYNLGTLSKDHTGAKMIPYLWDTVHKVSKFYRVITFRLLTLYIYHIRRQCRDTFNLLYLVGLEVMSQVSFIITSWFLRFCQCLRYFYWKNVLMLNINIEIKNRWVLLI